MKGPTCAAFLTFLAQIAPLCSRVSLGRHGSFMPHAAIYKIMQSILPICGWCCSWWAD